MTLEPCEPTPSGPSSGDGPGTAHVRAYPDGPFLIRGDFVLQDVDGDEITVHRSVTALCRCGRSAQAPLCDGSHRSPRRRS